ncbi:Uncharacterized protein, UPF0262 family [Limimonas halophila]|uniref:UPF0262 protein SAMN05216241_10456 n=1 Tax=Limimonas halophila TaxID=1082479 RepID=A0A1G7QNH4_9PROT|nr:UPF0262 family protein [Limimonas halophila]SDF99429.1 Uncharacterized protein, UPF0262 family [Limimonas halophila]
MSGEPENPGGADPGGDTTANYIAQVTLDERTVVRRSRDVEHERQIAIHDLLNDNRFRPYGELAPGPYSLNLRLEESRMILDIHSGEGAYQDSITVGLSPFRRIIKDYFTVCESYYEAIRTASPSQIEAIDMGRRGLHNEGSELLQQRLSSKADVDFDTARRLFTLLCVLHIRG